MEVLGKIGIDVNLYVAQIINFCLLLLLLSKLIYKPIIKLIEHRESEQKEIEAERILLKNQTIEAEKNISKKLLDATQKSKQIIAEAETISKQIKKASFEEAQLEKKAVIAQIKSRLKDLD